MINLKCILLLFMSLWCRLALGQEVVSLDQEEVKKLLDEMHIPQSIRDYEESRIYIYKTSSLMSEIIDCLEDYYKKNNYFPNLREWPRYIDESLTNIDVDLNKGIVYDGFGSPFIYMPVAKNEVWLLSVNLFDKDDNGNEKVIIYKLIDGKLNIDEDFYEP